MIRALVVREDRPVDALASDDVLIRVVDFRARQVDLQRHRSPLLMVVNEERSVSRCATRPPAADPNHVIYTGIRYLVEIGDGVLPSDARRV